VKIITKEGDVSQRPKAGQEMEMHYTGTLPDGTQFDSSRSKGRTFKFVLGQGRVIQGWEKGVATMCLGERANLVCGPDHAYGASGIPGIIPPNAVLIFDVELINFK